MPTLNPRLQVAIILDLELEEIEDLILTDESLQLLSMTDNEWEHTWRTAVRDVQSSDFTTPQDHVEEHFQEIRVNFVKNWRACNDKITTEDRLLCKATRLIEYLIACMDRT